MFVVSKDLSVVGRRKKTNFKKTVNSLINKENSTVKGAIVS